MKIIVPKVLTVCIAFIGIQCITTSEIHAQQGTIDPTFAPKDTGFAVCGAFGTVHNSHILQDGKILITGNFVKYNRLASKNIARLLSNGLPDASFQSGAGTDTTVLCAEQQSNGSILIGGLFRKYNGITKQYLARIGVNGLLDNSFQTTVDSMVQAIQILPNQKILIAGNFTQCNGQSRNRIAILNPDGSLSSDPDFGSGANGPVLTVALQADGKILIGGSFTTFNGQVKQPIRLLSDGSFDSGFLGNIPGFDPSQEVTKLVPAQDGGIWMIWSGGLQKLKADGTPANSFVCPNMGSWINFFRLNDVVEDGNTVLLAGAFGWVGTNSNRCASLIRMDLHGNLINLCAAAWGDSWIMDLDVLPGGKILASGGIYPMYPGVGPMGISRLQTNLRVDPTFNASQYTAGVWNVAEQPDRKLIITGTFHHVQGQERQRIARLNEDGTLDPTFYAKIGDLHNREYDPGGLVTSNTRIQPDGKILVSGWFYRVNDLPARRLVRLHPDGSLDASFKVDTTVLTSDVQDPPLLLCPDGKMYTNKGKFPYRLLPNGSIDPSFQIPAITNNGGLIRSMALQADGKLLFVVDRMTQVNGVNRKIIARLLPNGQLDPDFNVGTGPVMANNYTETRIRPLANGKILFSATFTSFNGSSRRNLVRLLPNGNVDPDFNLNTSLAHKDALIVCVQSDGKILLSLGINAPVGGMDYFLVRIDSSGNQDLTFTPLPLISHRLTGTLLASGNIILSGNGAAGTLKAAFPDDNAQHTGKELIRLFGNPTNLPDPYNLIKGTVFKNVNNDCIKDANEDPALYRIMKATPGPVWGNTGTNGQYEIKSDSGVYQVSQVLNQFQNLIENQVCPISNASHTASFEHTLGDTISGLDFANNAVECPFLTVSVASNRRRCYHVENTFVNVFNQGYAASSPQTKAYVKLPKWVTLQSASMAYTFNPADSTYIFNIGTIQAHSGVTIQITDYAACGPDYGNIILVYSAWVTPSNNCIPVSPNFDGVDLTVNAGCKDEKPRFKVLNKGTFMASARALRVYVDSLFAFQHYFQLGAGDSLVFAPLVSGDHTVRVEVPQSPFHPTSSFAADETNCLGMPDGFRYFAPPVHPNVSINGLPLEGPAGRNALQVSPIGSGTEGKILANRSLTYRINFQNTSSDSIHHVVIMDTLPEMVDMSTLQLGASSHPYQFSVSGSGRPVLTFSLNGISLPDSGVNELASNGFVSFSIMPFGSTPLGTRIENSATIYMDYQKPLSTNQTLNTLYNPDLVPGLVDSIQIITSVKEVHLSGQKISIFPNPTKGNLEINLPEAGQMQLFNVQGERVMEGSVRKGSNPIQLTTLPKGLYLVRFQIGEQQEVRKLVLE